MVVEEVCLSRGFPQWKRFPIRKEPGHLTSFDTAPGVLPSMSQKTGIKHRHRPQRCSITRKQEEVVTISASHSWTDYHQLLIPQLTLVLLVRYFQASSVYSRKQISIGTFAAVLGRHLIRLNTPINACCGILPEYQAKRCLGRYRWLGYEEGRRWHSPMRRNTQSNKTLFRGWLSVWYLILSCMSHPLHYLRVAVLRIIWCGCFFSMMNDYWTAHQNLQIYCQSTGCSSQLLEKLSPSHGTQRG